MAGKMTEEQRDDMRRQVYTANLRGMRPSEIARAFDISEKTADTLLREAREERVKNYQEYEKEDEDGSTTFLLDHIQSLRNSMFTTINQLRRGGSKSNNISGLYNGLIHLLELELKMKGKLQTRVTGADGTGPVEIMNVTDRAKMIEELKQLVAQEEQLITDNQTNLYLEAPNDS